MKSPVPNHLARILLPVGLGLLAAFSWSGTAAGQLQVPYDVALEGVADDELRGELEAVLESITLREQPPPTLDLLRRRVEQDVSRLEDALRALGYYGAEVDVSINEEKTPVLVAFHVEPGQVYRIDDVILEVEGAPEAAMELPSPEGIGLEAGEPARSSSILEAQSELVRQLKVKGYALAEIAERRLVVDHSTRGMTVRFTVALGPLAHFGPTTVVGLESVEERFIRRRIPWQVGERFNMELLDELQKNLVDTRLFGLVRVMPAVKATEEGLLPVTVEVKERKHRTVSAGVRYQTDEGPGVKITWENRNLFDEGEILDLSAIASGITYALEGSYQEPWFLQRDQKLLLKSRVAQDDTDAYTSQNVEAAVIVERQLGPGMRIGAGPAFRLAEVDQFEEVEDDEDMSMEAESFVLLSFPAYFNMDRTDNLLDPTRGGRLNIQVSPFLETLNAERFLKSYASYSHYFMLAEQPRLILAGRAALGFISGSERNDIPADVRFYSGGGGSIRGYSFQTVGPLDDDDPLGGRSLAEVSTELRLKITESIGVVAFLDGGSAFESTYPDFNRTIRWGAGTGLRYFTPIGPLRLDVAFPLNRREGIDDSFQVYLSLGQAF